MHEAYPVKRDDKINIQQANVLVWLPSPMGDAVLCTPALRSIRQYFKSGEITFYANSIVRQILSPCSFNDAWIDYENENPFLVSKELKKHNFTHAILFKNSFASALAVRLAKIPCRIGYAREKRGFLLTDKLYPAKLSNGKYKPVSMVDYYLEIASHIGAETTNTNLELSIDKNDSISLQDILPELSDCEGPLVIFVPGGAFGPSKCWPTQNFAKTADLLIENHNASIVISVAPVESEKRIAQEICRKTKYFNMANKTGTENKIINLAEKTVSLRQLKALYSLADLVIANDTGPRHIAIALSRKVITLFGPNNPVWTDTKYENEIQITGNVLCAPCHNPKCKKSRHLCMESISVDMVYDAASQLIENKIKQHKVFSRPQFIEPSESFLIDGDYVTALNNVGINSIESIFAFEAAKNLTKKNLAVFRSRLQFEVDLPNASSPNTLFLKRYDNPPVVLQLKNWLLAHKRVSCGMLESETTQLLSEYGINTPRIIAYGEQSGILFEKRSFFITEKIPNAEALERKLPVYFHNGSTSENLKLQRDFINHLARFIKKFHSTGYRHRDLYFSHIFLDDKERFFLIDLARAFRPILQAGRFRIKDIAQLYYSAPRKYFSTTDRLRFYISYIGRKKLNGTDKTFIKKVLKKVQQMVKHDKKHGKEAPFES